MTVHLLYLRLLLPVLTLPPLPLAVFLFRTSFCRVRNRRLVSGLNMNGCARTFTVPRYVGGRTNRTTAYRGLHWRGGLNPITNSTVGLWETETNCDRKSWVNSIMVTPARDSDPASVACWMFMGAKCLLRMYVFYIHKGMGCVFAFSDRNPNEPYVLSMIPESFFNALCRLMAVC